MVTLTRSNRISKDISNLKSLHNSGVAYSFEYTDSQDRVSNHPSELCYGGMCILPFCEQRKVKSIITMLKYGKHKNKLDVGYMNDYWKWMVSKESPYHSLTKNGVELSLQTEEEAPTVKVNICNDTSTQLLISFLINMRMGRDSPEFIRMFYSLLEKGFEPVEAFYTSIYFRLDKDNEVILGLLRPSPALNSYVNNDFNKLKKGEPTLDIKAYNMTKGYQQGLEVSKIWFSDDLYKDEKYKSIGYVADAEIYYSLGKINEYTGKFSKLYELSNLKLPLCAPPSLDELVENKELIFN